MSFSNSRVEQYGFKSLNTKGWKSFLNSKNKNGDTISVT